MCCSAGQQQGRKAVATAYCLKPALDGVAVLLVVLLSLLSLQGMYAFCCCSLFFSVFFVCFPFPFSLFYPLRLSSLLLPRCSHTALALSLVARSTNFAAAPTVFVRSPVPAALSAAVKSPTPSSVCTCTIGNRSYSAIGSWLQPVWWQCVWPATSRGVQLQAWNGQCRKKWALSSGHEPLQYAHVSKCQY